MRETDVLVAGAGTAGRAAAAVAAAQGARVLLVDGADHAVDAPGADVRALPSAMLVDVILSPDGHVAGALVTNPREYRVEPVRAKAVVLATGGASGLWTAGGGLGSGVAVAHRAGADLADLEPVEADGRVELKGGVASDGAGLTAVAGLRVAGSVAARRVDGAAVGHAVVPALPEKPPQLGPYSVMPNVDSPLPRGFVDVKLDRLRAVMARHFPPGGPHDAEAGRVLLHQLKGEGDEFARARVDNELLAFKSACEVAVLVARSAAEA